LGVARLSLIGLALTVALAGCRGESQESSSAPEAQPVATEAQPAATEAQPKTPESKTIDSPEAHSQLVNELAESRKQAQAKQEPIDPEIAKRMKDPEYRKQKDEMLNKLSQVSTAYFKQGIEIRHTRKRPEWRLIDPRLAEITDVAARKQKGEELAKKFKGEVEPVLDKPIDVIVFADASESIQVY
jgi:DNA polymerase III gamma/tau subunit